MTYLFKPVHIWPNIVYFFNFTTWCNIWKPTFSNVWQHLWMSLNAFVLIYRSKYQTDIDWQINVLNLQLYCGTFLYYIVNNYLFVWIQYLSNFTVRIHKSCLSNCFFIGGSIRAKNQVREGYCNVIKHTWLLDCDNSKFRPLRPSDMIYSTGMFFSSFRQSNLK